MPKMICAKDGCELHPIKNGVYEIVMANFGAYQIYRADLWGCAGCGAEIVAGSSQEPIVEHFDSNFKNVLDRVLKERHFYNYGRRGEYKPK